MLFLQPTSTAPSVPTAAPKDVPKAPIPAEHQVLQAQFGGLVEKCIAQATNAVSKTKINFPKTLRKSRQLPVFLLWLIVSVCVLIAGKYLRS